MIRRIKNLKSTRRVTMDVLHRIIRNPDDDSYFLLYPSSHLGKYDILWVDTERTEVDNIITLESNVETHRINHISTYNLNDLILVTHGDIAGIHEAGKYVDVSNILSILDEFLYTNNALLSIR